MDAGAEAGREEGLYSTTSNLAIFSFPMERDERLAYCLAPCALQIFFFIGEKKKGLLSAPECGTFSVRVIRVLCICDIAQYCEK